MLEQFTDRARLTMGHANQEAIRLGNEYIGTEHILLGLLKSDESCVKILTGLGHELSSLQEQIEKSVLPSDSPLKHGRLPQTPRAKKVIEYAIEEARALRHRHIGTEHLLLGLLHDRNTVGCQVLSKFGIELADVRRSVVADGHAEK